MSYETHFLCSHRDHAVPPGVKELKRLLELSDLVLGKVLALAAHDEAVDADAAGEEEES